MAFAPVTAATAEQTELVFALVAAVGTDIHQVEAELSTQLSAYGYTSHRMRLSDYLAEQAGQNFREMPFDESLWEAMTAGDELRRRWERSDALALHAISDIVATRYEVAGLDPSADKETLPPNLDRHAFILRSLKTPDELETLRSVYGSRLLVVAAYSPRDKRIEHLAQEIEDSRETAERSSWRFQPEELIDRDEREEQERGQDVSRTFHRADLFIRGWSRKVVKDDLKRSLSIFFGDPFRTPTRDEHAQFMAAGAALRSAEFGRQVGAAIATKSGSVIALGTNEVPVPGGGSHWEEDGPGNRDFETSEIDTNRRQFDALADKLVEKVDKTLKAAGESLAASDGYDPAGFTELRGAAKKTLARDLRQAGLGELTEFGRAVHAEMNALLDAARRGVSVQDSTLYTTTFPCHNCARHIIGAGVERVVFIEPYIKSRAKELHEDALEIEHFGRKGSKLSFEPFVGVAPRRYLEFFDASMRERMGRTPRQDKAGKKLKFEKKTALPVVADAALPQFRPEYRDYRAKEIFALDYFEQHSQAAEADPSGATSKAMPIGADG
jgi:deoxycytidylate deaminase